MNLPAAAASLAILLGQAALPAADPWIGTWKLDASRSGRTPGAGRNTTVVYALVGEEVKVVTEGVDGTGRPTRTEWTGKLDGRDYPTKGDDTADVRSYRKVDARTLAFTGKKGGVVTISGRIVVSPDGKSRTVTATAIDPNGNPVTTTAVFSRQ